MSVVVETDGEKRRVKFKDIVWHNVLILGLIHVLAFYGLYLSWTQSMLKTNIFWKIIATFSAYGVTAGAHRLWSHRTYKANMTAQIILMVFMTFTYQNSIYTWCRDHRLHHKFSETDADPHNSKRGFFFSHMGWLFVRKHPAVKEKGKELDMSDLVQNPLVMFQHRYYYLLVFLIGVFPSTFIPWYFWGEQLKISFLSATLYRIIVSLHATWGINSLAHLCGNKPYNTKIGATENPLMKYCSFGEGFHNYHHTFPWDYKAAEYSSDARNSTTLLIDLFAKLGWVSDRQTVSKALIQKQSQTAGSDVHKDTGRIIRDTFLVFTYLYLL